MSKLRWSLPLLFLSISAPALAHGEEALALPGGTLSALLVVAISGRILRSAWLGTIVALIAAPIASVPFLARQPRPTPKPHQRLVLSNWLSAICHRGLGRCGAFSPLAARAP